MGGTLFSDAGSTYSHSKYVIFGAPLDITGTHRKGSAEAPQAIRRESYTFESFIPDMKMDLSMIPTHDMGDLPMEKPREEILEAVKGILKDGKVPIMLGGEHSVTPYAIEAFHDVAVLVFDAHLDYRNELKGDKNNHACATRRIDEIISPEKVLPVGIRSICKSEFEDAERLGLDYVTADRARELGTKKLIEFIDSTLPGNLYVSVDMDGIDPAYAPGVGTPEPFGLESAMVRDIIRHLAHRTVGFDMVEVCPPADNGNTSVLAARLIKDFIGAREMAVQR
ncbi:MAG: agmatinase [Candidatus Thermoplasmatota archaeon]|nr:agmatinase [Euryarchaeota archaeon]MBU4033071.1 agmatinase [Candidatus Thermoplasmatota archaeon]MBU4072337.1 agmatinase [Candidatus Thermoplasmatota archaeon]MBU4143631.1 agmatinase [Candidatus Thermoplasmatota archaeon]MBU4591291.1 agmatinase [Candidatus Thermoplasmatota archaeon]